MAKKISRETDDDDEEEVANGSRAESEMSRMEAHHSEKSTIDTIR